MSIKRLLQAKVSGGNEEDEAILRTQAVKVNSINDEVKETIEDLRDTLWAYPFCRGLSANQIGSPYAITVINVNRNSRDEDQILINPEIISTSGKKDKKRESCMSIWGKQGEVERRDHVKVAYLDELLNKKNLDLIGFDSRAYQHEIDHLSGILYIDKLVPGKALEKADFFDDYEIIR